MRFAIILAGALLAAGCRAPLEGAPCPCLSGYQCTVENVCVLATGVTDASTQDDAGWYPDGSAPDASIDAGDFPDAGPSDSGPEPDASGASDAGLAVWYER